MFGLDQQFNIRGQSTINTLWGAFMSLVLFAVILAYGVYRWITLFELDDTNVQKLNRMNYFTEKDHFT